MICVSAQKGLVTRAAITQTAVNMEFFLFFAKLSQIDWHLHANLWVKILNIHRSRISALFRNVENSQKLALKAPGNGQTVTYSKMLKLDKKEFLDPKMSDLVKFLTFACLTCFLCYRSRSITLCLFLKLILVRFWCLTIHFKAYDLLYKNLNSYCH